jgi:transketolase
MKMKDSVEMRQVYSNGLLKLGEKNDRIVVMDADLMRSNGATVFRDKFPERTFDIGVAEQNMISIAGGLSAYGFIPFASTFAIFASRRVMDQVMISVAYAKQNVKIVGTDPGISAELNGGTHMPFEDVGMMRTIPEMTIFEPVDATQLEQAMPQIAEHKGPLYMRLFRKTADKIFDENYRFQLGKADTIAEGNDAVIFATGLLVKNSVDAADMLKNEGISVKVVNIHTIKPLDSEAVLKAAKETGAVVTVENHNIINGLGSAVAEVLAENCAVPMKRIGVKDSFGEVGPLDYLMERFELTTEDIIKAVKCVIKKK